MEGKDPSTLYTFQSTDLEKLQIFLSHSEITQISASNLMLVINDLDITSRYILFSLINHNKKYVELAD